MFSAVSNLGAGGIQDVALSDTANGVLYGAFALTGLVSGGINNGSPPIRHPASLNVLLISWFILQCSVPVSLSFSSVHLSIMHHARAKLTDLGYFWLCTLRRCSLGVRG